MSICVFFAPDLFVFFVFVFIVVLGTLNFHVCIVKFFCLKKKQHQLYIDFSNLFLIRLIKTFTFQATWYDTLNIYFCVCVCVFGYFTCIYVCVSCVYLVPTESKGRYQSPGTGVINSHELPCGCWELNTLEEQLLVFTVESAPQSMINLFECGAF